MRLDKLLANKAFGSRKEVHQIIKDGRVTVNSTVILKKDQFIHIDDDIIAVDGIQLSTKQQYYIKFHKPAGYITAVEDPIHPVVMDLLPPEFKKMGVFPVGRLDKDTEGLLLLTNDGIWAHSIINGHKHVPKLYYVEFKGKLTQEGLKEGKYHQVKRMIGAAGGEVTYLKRLSIGHITLNGIEAINTYSELDDQDVVDFKK